jgi:hypothetical protein
MAYFSLSRLDFESQANILQKTSVERKKQYDIAYDRLYEQVKGLEKAREELIKENRYLNTTIKQMNDFSTELEREQEKSRELYKKCVKFETQLASTSGIEVIFLTFFFSILY